MSLKRLMYLEIETINRCLFDHGVDAGTSPGRTTVASSSFIAYGIQLGRGERIANIHKLLPELQEALSSARGRAVPVRLRTLPLALELPHPAPRPLTIDVATLDGPPHTMLLGRSYGIDGVTDERLDLAEQPHVLVAGITGAGKSVLLSMMLLTLVRNTTPTDLRIVAVDLKNEDLRPFRSWPHVEAFANDPESAISAVDHVFRTKEERRTSRRRPHRLVLAIDELAELPAPAVEQLGSILALGRSMAISVVAATQHPLASVVGGIAKANFPVRLVGMVSDANAAAVATGRKGTGAEFLPGRGSFLRIQSADVVRFQTYMLTAGDIEQVSRELVATWGAAPSAERPAPDLLQTQQIPPAVAAVFAEYAGPDGLRRGGIAAALRALHGSAAPKSGRAYQEATAGVNDLFTAWLNTSGETSPHASWSTSGSVSTREKSPEIRTSGNSEAKFWM